MNSPPLSNETFGEDEFVIAVSPMRELLQFDAGQRDPCSHRTAI
jgi:hypothetical protein